LVRYIWLDTFG